MVIDGTIKFYNSDNKVNKNFDSLINIQQIMLHGKCLEIQI